MKQDKLTSLRSTRFGLGVAAAALVTFASAATYAQETMTTLHYATPLTTEVIDVGERPLIEEFMRRNPDIRVEIEQIPFSNYNTRLTTEIRGGQGPDIGRINHSDVMLFGGARFLLPLDAAIAEQGIDTSVFIPGLLDVGQMGGVQMTLPMTTDARVLFYNPRLLAEKGFDAAPATWEELIAVTAAFGGTDIAGYGLVSDSDFALSYNQLGPYIIGSGGTLLSDDGSAAVAAESEGVIAAVEMMQEMVRTGGTTPNIEATSGANLTQMFAQDRLAMMLGGPWTRTSILNANPDLVYGTDFATAPVPVRQEGMSSGSVAGGWHMGIFANTSHPEAAARLLAFLMEPENLIALNANEAFPPLVGGLGNEPWSSDPFFAAFDAVLPGSNVPFTPVARFAEVSAAFGRAMTPVLADPSGSVHEALADFDRQVNTQILD